MFRELLTLLLTFILNFIGVSSMYGVGSSPIHVKVGEFAVFCPSGFRVTISPEIHATSMTFRGTHRSRGYKEVATWFASVHPENGLLKFENSTANIKIGDVLVLDINFTSVGPYVSRLRGRSVVGGRNSKPSGECMPWTQVLVKTSEGNIGHSVFESVQLDVYPQQGFQISIPVESDVESMTFKGDLYNHVGGVLIDSWIANDVRPQNGLLRYSNCTSIVETENIFDYEIYLITVEQTQRYLTGEFMVLAYIHHDKCKPSVAMQQNFVNGASSQLALESVKVNVFYPNGFQLSIPAGNGRISMAFNGKLNQELDTFEDSTWIADNLHPKNGQLIFENTTSQLRIGDVIYYRITVTSFGQTKQYLDGVHMVTGYTNKVGNTNLWQAPSTDYTGAVCKPSITAVNGVQQKCAERLIFNEQFSGFEIDTSKWTPQQRFAGPPNFGFVTYLRRQDVIYVDRGNLCIEPKRIADIYGDTVFNYNLTLNLQPDCTGEPDTKDCIRTNSVDIVPPIASGQITTKGYFSFLYGSVQIRAKLPDIPWSFVQFFLEPSENVYGKHNFSSGQMRLAFATGLDTCVLSGGVISKDDKQIQKHMCEKPCSHDRKWSSYYHVYCLKWTPASITLSVDGEQYCRIDPMKKPFSIGDNGEMIPTLTSQRQTTEMAPFDQSFHLTIGLGIGGHTEFYDGVPDKPWNNLDPRSMRKFWYAVRHKEYPKGRLEVDYIQVFTV